jgi:hypothetical protein
MRSRLGFVLIAATLPSVALAQRTTGTVGRVVPPQTSRTPRPAEKPPQAPGIPDSRLYTQYRMSRFSFEQYPMITALQTTGAIAPGFASNHTMFGDGSHIGFRITPSLGVTTDLASAFTGAPFSFGSVDFGMRLKPWASARFRPFVDARLSHAYVVPASGIANTVPVVLIARSELGDLTTGSGNGGLFGLGAETTLGRNWVLSSALSATRYTMIGRQLTGSRREWAYTADAYRLGVGFRYNPGHWYEAH